MSYFVYFPVDTVPAPTSTPKTALVAIKHEHVNDSTSNTTSQADTKDLATDAGETTSQADDQDREENDEDDSSDDGQDQLPSRSDLLVLSLYGSARPLRGAVKVASFVNTLASSRAQPLCFVSQTLYESNNKQNTVTCWGRLTSVDAFDQLIQSLNPLVWSCGE